MACTRTVICGAVALVVALGAPPCAESTSKAPPPDSPQPSPLPRKRLTNPSEGLLVSIPGLSPLFFQRQHRIRLFRPQPGQFAPAEALPCEKLFHPPNALGRHPRSRTLLGSNPSP